MLLNLIDLRLDFWRLVTFINYHKWPMCFLIGIIYIYIFTLIIFDLKQGLVVWGLYLSIYSTQLQYTYTRNIIRIFFVHFFLPLALFPLSTFVSPSSPPPPFFSWDELTGVCVCLCVTHGVCVCGRKGETILTSWIQLSLQVNYIYPEDWTYIISSG